MEQTLHVLKDPVRVKGGEWLLAYKGRVSAARETEEHGIVEILAYSDNCEDFPRVEDMAHIPGGCIIRNVSEPEVNCLDECIY